MTPAARLVGTAGYLPEHVVSAAEIAEQSGIPEQIIVDRFGLTGRHLAADDEHVCDMAVIAGERVLEQTALEPADVDVVVYFGSTWKEYPVWQAAPHIAHRLGCDGAFAMELDYVSCGTPVALRVVRDMLVAEPDLRTVLLVGASREARLIDPADRGTRFALNFGDGAVGAVLTRGESATAGGGFATVLGSHATTNGSYSLQVKMPIGGSKRPVPGPGGPADYVPKLQVADLEDMKHGLDSDSLPAFRTAAEIAVKRSGATLADIDVVCPIHMKRSMHHALLAELGVSDADAVYLDDTGHMSGVDPLLGLDRARRGGRLRPGALCLLIAGGTGYTWAATCVRVETS
ncbi:3-oxoacyl-ACP synthase [Flexivirga oryzae]|uniref:3-oxoacyl-[acyl-carrier-protein] synthase-3 n=1 Tax=Flexivirga oryzae TaxID=1794944 RepID=A0A839NC29_9MICO|nr:3-oxoacyl-[acyl-carrier-protein] synthase-3 [Flexivirga oryzae]